MVKLENITDNVKTDRILLEYAFHPKDDEFGSLSNSSKNSSLPREIVFITNLSNNIASTLYNATLIENGICNVSHINNMHLGSPDRTVATLYRECYYKFGSKPICKVKYAGDLNIKVGITNNKYTNIATLSINIAAYGGKGIILDRYEELDNVLKRRILSRRWMPVNKVYRNEEKLEKYVIENIKNAIDGYVILPG